MALTVGVDSYVTLEEAELYITNNYVSNSKVKEKWNGLSNADKEALLRASCKSLNAIRYDGVKLRVSQPLAFPRKITAPVGIGYALYTSQFVDNSLFSSGGCGDGLKEASEAQIENAIYQGYLGGVVEEQAGVNIKGIVAKKAGPIAESYNINNRYNRNALRGIYTDKVYALLRDWICDSRYAV